MENSTPEGFYEIFDEEHQVPDPPKGDCLVNVRKATIVYHYASPLGGNVGMKLSAENRKKVEEMIIKILNQQKIGLDKDRIEIDEEIFYPIGRNFTRLIFGPLKMKINLAAENTLTGTSYLMVSIFDLHLVVFSLVLPINTGSEFSMNSIKELTSNDIRKLIRFYFEDSDVFEFSTRQHNLSQFFKSLISELTSKFSGFTKSLSFQRHVSLYIWSTRPNFTSARDFVWTYGYEFLAMIGEDEEWRQKSKTTVKTIIHYGMSPVDDEIIVPCHFTSLVLDGSPPTTNFFKKYALNVYTLIDCLSLVAALAFSAYSEQIEDKITECIGIKESAYVDIMCSLNELRIRYLLLKKQFYIVDHFWKDVAFMEYFNCLRDCYLDPLKGIAISALESSTEYLRAIAVQMAQVVTHKKEITTNRVVQIVTTLLSASMVFQLFTMAKEAFSLDPGLQLLIGLIIFVPLIAVIVVLTLRS